MPWAGEWHPFGVKKSEHCPVKDRILNVPIHPSAKRSSPKQPMTPERFQELLNLVEFES
jgi:hypothetical protein